jgi:hypothetical protein
MKQKGTVPILNYWLTYAVFEKDHLQNKFGKQALT